MIPPFALRISSTPRPRAGVLMALALAALVAAVACEKVPLLAPTDSTITVFAANPVVPLNGSVQITASVLESAGTPVQNGTLVTFATTLGQMSPVEARTTNGKATAMLQAGAQSGTAVVTAMSGSATAQSPEIMIGAAAASRIVVSASPAVVPASGGTVTIIATVVDASGNQLPGIPVTFQADAGSLSAATAVTDGLGQAQVQLHTGLDTTVTVTAGGQQATASVKASAAPIVTVSASGGTSGQIAAGQTVTFAVSVTAGTNSSGIFNVTIDYGDGDSDSLGALTGQTSVAHVYGHSGTYTVTVTATDTIGQRGTATTILVVQPRAPLQVTLIVSPVAPAVSQIVTMTASVTGTTGTSIDHVTWSFGDGAGVTTTGLTTSHVYTTTGTKVIQVTVTSVDGATGFAQAEIVVAASSGR